MVKTKGFGRFWVLVQWKWNYWGLGPQYARDPIPSTGGCLHKVILWLGPLKLVLGHR